MKEKTKTELNHNDLLAKYSDLNKYPLRNDSLIAASGISLNLTDGSCNGTDYYKSRLVLLQDGLNYCVKREYLYMDNTTRRMGYIGSSECLTNATEQFLDQCKNSFLTYEVFNSILEHIQHGSGSFEYAEHMAKRNSKTFN
tara:strand:+ start:290 stop:712 length:423 start_codon:yes stop_codon:yes gene_type:complete